MNLLMGCRGQARAGHELISQSRSEKRAEQVEGRQSDLALGSMAPPGRLSPRADLFCFRGRRFFRAFLCRLRHSGDEAHVFSSYLFGRRTRRWTRASRAGRGRTRWQRRWCRGLGRSRSRNGILHRRLRNGGVDLRLQQVLIRHCRYCVKYQAAGDDRQRRRRSMP